MRLTPPKMSKSAITVIAFHLLLLTNDYAA